MDDQWNVDNSFIFNENALFFGLIEIGNRHASTQVIILEYSGKLYLVFI
jgi:hypothetical protein